MKKLVDEAVVVCLDVLGLCFKRYLLIYEVEVFWVDPESGPILFRPLLKYGSETRTDSFHFINVYFCILVQVELDSVAAQQQI